MQTWPRDDHLSSEIHLRQDGLIYEVNELNCHQNVQKNIDQVNNRDSEAENLESCGPNQLTNYAQHAGIWMCGAHYVWQPTFTFSQVVYACISEEQSSHVQQPRFRS